MTETLLGSALLFFAAAKQVAFVDLSVPPKTGTSPQIEHVRGGGVLYHGNAPHPLPGTPPISLELKNIISTKEGDFIKDVVEVVITNTGKGPISVPIGDDPVPLLVPTEKDRRYFLFYVTLRRGKAVRGIAAAESACNSEHPESSAVLQPGDTVLFWVPAGTWQRTPDDGTNQEVSVSVSLNRNVIEKGIDWNEQIGEDVRSQNTLPMPHAAKVEMIH